MVVRDGRIRSVNRGLCDLTRLRTAGVARRGGGPFPFWPPEHRHEIESWHAELQERGELVAGAHVLPSPRRPYRVLCRRAGRRRRLRSEPSTRDCPRRVCEPPARTSADRALGTRRGDRAARPPRVRGAPRARGSAGKKTNTNLTVVLAQVSLHGRAGEGVLARPEALLAVDRLRRILRAGDDSARTGASELGWILPETDAAGGIEAVTRWRSGIADVDGVTLTAGLADLAGAGDALSLYALADRALADDVAAARARRCRHKPPAQPAGPSKRVEASRGRPRRVRTRPLRALLSLRYGC